MFTNNCLPKYFFGDTMNQDEQPEKNILNYSEDVHLSEPNLSSIPSPSSSLASTKKLEWDSGADIGYIYDSVKRSRKSKSYPSLIMEPPNSKSKVTKTKAKIHSSTGVRDTNTLACIGEGDDLLKSPKNSNKKPKSFKHSTPLDHRQMTRSCAGDGPVEKATSPINVHEIRDECLQTTLIHRSSKEVQTEFENVDKKQIEDKSLQTDLMESVSSSSSKSSSFKYIPGSEFTGNDSQSSKSNGTIKSGVTIKSSSNTNSKSTSTSSRTVESDSGSCSPLGQMISTQYSKNLITDIDKSLDVLQKFIKSKNYSNDTKKHYAKKIVTKIINNRYSDDTESSSEVKSSLLSNENNDKNVESIDKRYVECGIQCEEINKKSQIISDRSDCKIKESLDKLNALQVDLKNWRDAQTLSEKLFEARKTRKTRSKKPQEHSSSSSNVENSKRDCLIEHSKNERKRQLSWINNEITYLQKLKDLLQTKEQSSTSASSTLTKTLNSFHEIDERISHLTDIERKFNEQFGLLPDDSKEKLNKLSKFLSNEQIRFILDHDVHQKSESNRKIDLSSSYNSHKNSNRKTLSPVDVATQCTISKKSDGSDSRNLSDRPAVTDTAQQIKPPFCLIKDLSKSDQSSGDTSSKYDESIIIDKENLVERHRRPQNIEKNKKTKTITKLNKGGTAYFLTFEEESQSEIDNEERRVLEQVVVKIPKYHRSTRLLNTNSSSVTNEPCTNTLEEYLLKNRPNFVRTANWRWTQVRSLDSQDKHNVFTCQEMKEMSKRKYKKLPEIQEKVKNSRTQIERMRNRFMADIFSKKLQKKTLQGHICLPTCKDVMASD